MNIYAAEGFQYKKKGEAAKIIYQEGNHIGINVTITDKKKKNIELPLKIDTGAAGYMTIANQTIEQYGLMKEQKRYKPAKGFSIDTTITSNYRGKIKSVSFGQRTWKNVPVVFEVDPINIAASDKNSSYGLLGQQLLLDFNITYDFLKGLVYLQQRK